MRFYKLLNCYIVILLAILTFFGISKFSVYSISPECDQSAANIPQDRWETCRLEYEREAAVLGQANATNRSELSKLESQLKNLKQKIQSLSQQLAKLETDIAKREVDLGLQQELLGVRIRSYYIRSRYFSPFLLLLSSRTASNLTQELVLREMVTSQDKNAILSLATQIQKLKSDKEAVAKNKVSLASLQKTVDERASFLSKEIGKTETYLAVLSAKQQEILAAKSGGFIVSVGDSELADDYNASIKGFRESAPSGSFAIFSFGAHTHRNGMSQYGALGRSQTQETEQILSFYYPGKELKKDYAEPSTIRVKGPGKSCSGVAKNYDQNVDFQTYMKSIWEVPGSWPDKVLKAQAVAARSYAINRMNAVGYIVPNEGPGGQVYKDCEKTGGWTAAVEATRRWVLTSGGTAAFTEFSSTTGGWINGVGWDTTDGSGGNNFIDKAYEKVGGSPWVYKAWYTKEYSVNSDKCGRSNPWLTATDLADIVNAALVLKNKDDSRITPTTTSCWGGNPYSQSELKNVASQYGGINSVDSVSVIQGNGTTNEVVINGSVRLSGADFKKAFNLRAPGYVKIPQSGFAFFNIEKK